MDLDDVFDRSTLEIVDFLLDNPVMDYSKTEIAEQAGVSRSTLHRKWDVLEQLGIVKETRQYQNTRLYSLDEDADIVNLLGRLADTIDQEELQEAPLQQ